MKSLYVKRKKVRKKTDETDVTKWSNVMKKRKRSELR